MSRDSLVEPGPKVETGGRTGYRQQQEQEGGHQQRKAREERGRAQSREELRGGRRFEEGRVAGSKQSLAGEFIDFYLGRAKK